jgi:hypothetical protein
MANQSPDRREVLEMFAKAAFASQFPGFVRWACAAEHAMPVAVHPKPATYQPQFFTPEEYKTVDLLTELIIPRDESPGAHEAGVAEFIDFMVASDDEIQQPFRSGLRWLDSRAQTTYGSPFRNLGGDRQAEILKSLAYRDRFAPADVEGQKFFSLVRRYTVMGYYTSRVGLEQLDYPGLKFYSSSPACPHTGDPEHAHLPPPRF